MVAFGRVARYRCRMPKQKVKTQETINVQRNEAVALAVEEIKERFGEGAIMKLGEAKKVDIDAISTGSI